ncbi:MAG: response regulator transcription factor [Candidatus Dormibacteraeota bacterium]|nr:response regulator transcription factor [Candidatus Dormibacteraeota bacterium]MBV8445944.1 response regulator transcription factor [Candidatus Dormibacteraeota bacterium]
MTVAVATRPKRVLVVEDEEAIRQTLRYNLTREGYQVSEAASGDAALASARRERPDLILLDLMLPGMNGLEVCRVIRQEMATPILMLTAKSTEVDKVVGLQVGADDYVTKPFSLNELLARVAALLRRAEMHSQRAAEPLEVEEFSGFRIDRAARTVHVKGVEVRMAPKEFDLLSLLLLNPGRVLSRQTIIQTVWGSKFFGDSKTVDVHVRWLREKFENFDQLPFRITTVFGVGYRLDRLDREPRAAEAS